MDSSGADSSAPSASVDPDNNHTPASDDAPPPQPAVTSPGAGGRVKLMVSYGGRIQPRPHDNTRLAYVGGETKILALDRSARLPALLAKLASLAPSAPAPLCLKYQLPGEDLDALVSITDDDDLDHMMVEYDRLHRSSSSKPATRLRLFVFPIGPPPPPPSAALLDAARSDRQWFLDALNAVPAPPTPVEASSSPDFLFGLDQGFVPPPAVKVTVDLQPPLVFDHLPLEAPAKPDLANDERCHEIGGGADPAATAPAVASTAESRRLQIAEIPPPVIPRNSSEQTPPRVYPPDYQVPRAPERGALTAATQWPEQLGGVTVGSYASLAPGHDQKVYLFHASPGVYPGFYTAAPRIESGEAYRDAAAAIASTQVSSRVFGGVVGTGAEAYARGGGGGQLAYDSTGRVVYYASMVPTYETVTSVALNPIDAAVNAAKPSQIS